MNHPCHWCYLLPMLHHLDVFVIAMCAFGPWHYSTIKCAAGPLLIKANVNR